MAVLSIAVELGKFPYEVEEVFTTDDLAEFIAYRRIVDRETKKKMDQAARKSKVSGRARR